MGVVISGNGLTTYGPLSLLVTPDMIDSISVDHNGGTTYEVGTDEQGGAVVTASFLSSSGCSAQEGVLILINDVIPWTRLYCSFLSVGTASCWGWNGNNGYGIGLDPQDGNLLTYSEDDGDFTQNEFNVWDLPQFNKYFSACDNDTFNYMHGSYAVGPYRGFDMFCRRDSMESLAGPVHSRTCVPLTGQITIQRMRIII